MLLSVLACDLLPLSWRQLASWFDWAVVAGVAPVELAESAAEPVALVGLPAAQ